MRSLARTAAAKSSFCSVVSRLDFATIRAVYRYRSENEEILRTPEFMLNDLCALGYMEGDCDDISTFAAAYALCRGLRVRFSAIIYTPGKTEFQHVYPEIRQGGDWTPIDLTVPPGTIPRYIHRIIQEV